jgi:hypothetical protein
MDLCADHLGQLARVVDVVLVVERLRVRLGRAYPAGDVYKRLIDGHRLEVVRVRHEDGIELGGELLVPACHQLAIYTQLPRLDILLELVWDRDDPRAKSAGLLEATDQCRSRCLCCGSIHTSYRP